MIPVIDWSAIVFILAAIGLCIFMLVVPRLLGGTSKGFQKQENFESGVVSAGSARIRLSAKFYIVAIFFVIFDLEALYLYTYAVSVKEAGWLGFWTVVLFVPLGYLFSRLGLNDFWFTFPVTEVITTLVGVFFYRRFMAQQK